MNSRQREYLQYTLGREEEFIKSLKKIYQDALDDINTRIADLRGRSDLENKQSIIYQLNYQESLRKQVNAILDDLHGKEYSTMEDYLRECYDNGFIGTMYDLHGQGIPLVLPIDQDNVLRSLTINSKLSKSLYESLGEDISKLKNKVRINISRGFASNMSFAEITRNIANMSKIGINNAIRIARTEGHRIQTEATMDAQKEAQNNGADIVKQWDATLDGRTRLSHRKLDGQIRELDDYFEVDGHKAKAPHQFNIPSEDINCRCALLQRARWALKEGEIAKINYERDDIVKIKADNYQDFQDSYNKESNRISETRAEVKKKTKMNKEVINSKDYGEKFDIFNENVSKSLRDACRELIKEHDQTTNEGYSLIDFERGKTLKHVKNIGNMGGEALLNNVDKPVILAHNHPYSTTFSDDDVRYFFTHDKVHGMVAAGHNGTVFSLKVGKYSLKKTDFVNKTKNYEIFKEKMSHIHLDIDKVDFNNLDIDILYNMIYDKYEDLEKTIRAIANLLNWIYERK